MPIKAVLFDLDDTLIVDEAVSKEAMENTAEHASKLFNVKHGSFQSAAVNIASKLWREGPCYGYCREIGISFHECLWGEFLGETPELIALRNWAHQYRRDVFDAALREQGILDPEAGLDLSRVFANSRRHLQQLMPHAKDTLVHLKKHYQLALLTNGAPDLQREKIAASGLESHFDSIAISGEHGVGKPRQEIFSLLLNKLGVAPLQAIMVGNSLERDIAGAKNAQLAAAIWLRVLGSEETANVVPDYTITDLCELPTLIQRLV